MKRYLALTLALCMALTLLPGCGKSDEDEVYVPTGDALLMEGQDPEDLITGETEPQNLTLAYNPGRSMNPLIGYSYNNRVLFSLMYQGLFAYDSSGSTYPILCSGYQVSSDNRTWTFYVEPRATFSDGSTVTIEDVYASYQAAKESDYYKGRFQYYVNSFEIQNGAIVFSLTSPFENFPILLDIPIVKAADVGADYPRGTGPYELANTCAGSSTGGAVMPRCPPPTTPSPWWRRIPTPRSGTSSSSTMWAWCAPTPCPTSTRTTAATMSCGMWTAACSCTWAATCSTATILRTACFARC